MTLQEQLQHKIDTKTKPLGSLGKLEKIALQVGLLQKTLTPEIKKPAVFTFAADHGLTEAGVSAYPKAVTCQMVQNFLDGGAAINVFCNQHNLQLKVVDAGVDTDFPAHPMLIAAKVRKGTRNILEAPAMTMDECKQALQNGRDIVDRQAREGTNIIAFGEMGIGNTSAASLLLSQFANLPIAACTDRGTGHDDKGLRKKIDILTKALEKHPGIQDPMKRLATFGGLEIATMCGACLEAAKHRMLILVDGFIATSAVMVAIGMEPSVQQACLFTHQSGEQGHKHMLNYLNAEPLLHLQMRLGEGTGAAIAFPLVQSAIAFLNQMASFDSANVSGKQA
ncbi:MAG: nicotinate-nucleotide--dimethylbenzimidazole phosphoribosyltransferase [Bacteroidales bacterium]